MTCVVCNVVVVSVLLRLVILRIAYVVVDCTWPGLWDNIAFEFESSSLTNYERSPKCDLLV